MSDQVGTAVERFFRKPNLIALRELALRRTADRVDAAAREQGLPGSPSRAYLARDRLLVAIGPDDQAEQLVRTGKRLADALDAEWTAVYVETPALQRLAASRARPAHRHPAPRRVAGGRHRHAGRPDGGDARSWNTRARAARHACIVGEPKRRGVAGAVPAVDGDRARATRAGAST